MADEFQVTRSGVRPSGAAKQWEAQLADEQRTAWVAVQLGFACNSRDLGDLYVTGVLKRLAVGSVVAAVTTSTLATGVNVDAVQHVTIWTEPTTASARSAALVFGAHELAQMIGQGGR
jgi:hypothetical protein